MSMVFELGIGSINIQPNEASGPYNAIEERRSRPRIKVHWSGILFPEDSTEHIETVTQDLSSTGLYCVVPLSFRRTEYFTAILKMPAHDPITGTTVRNLKCRLRLVRVESPLKDGKSVGVAFAIEDYHLLIPSQE